MNHLTELANSYNSDKGNVYKCAHHYTQHYEKVFSKYRNKPNFSLLEIGLNRDDCSEVPSLRMYRDYFGKEAKLSGFDIRPEFKAFEEAGFEIFIGDQSSPDSLKQCLTGQYDIIIDDGSHASSHQQISLRELWQAVKPGGIYVIEDLHWQPFSESCPNTRALADRWIAGEWESSTFFPLKWMEQFKTELKRIELLPSASPLHAVELTQKALLFLWKK